MKSGIYRIVAPSGGFYIGSAVDFSRRKSQHFHLLRSGNHINKALQRAAKKYGIEALKFERLIVCRPQDLIFFEQRAIDVMRPRYNACRTAGSQLGRTHSSATKRKISANRRGKGHHSEEWRRCASERMARRPFCGLRLLPREVREKISAALKGKKHADGFEVTVSEQQRQEIVSSYLNGMGQLALAANWRTSHKSIRRILVSAGIEISPSGHSIKRLKDGS